MANKFYFNEKEVRVMLAEYQKTSVMVNGIVMHKDANLERKIAIEVQKIIIAVINTYRYWVFEELDDLKQEGMRACFPNFMKFTPDKGTAFNYFSLITKIHLLNFTDRRKRHRNLADVDDCLDVPCKKEVNYTIFFNDLETTLFRIIDELYVGAKRKRYVRITAIILDYLRKSQKFVSRSDLYAWSRSWGVKSSLVREYIKDLATYLPEIMEVVVE